MQFSEIFNYFNQLSRSIGLPPLVLLCTIALIFFLFIFGLVILNKVSRIRKNLMILNSGLRTLNLRIQSELAGLRAELGSIKQASKNSKYQFQKQDAPANKPDIEISNELNLLSEAGGQNEIQAQNSPDLDLRKDEILENWEKLSDVKNKILFLLNMSSRPISYTEIAKYLSKDSPDYDFELILKELEQLKTEGEITSQVSAGKLYFQKK